MAQPKQHEADVAPKVPKRFGWWLAPVCFVISCGVCLIPFLPLLTPSKIGQPGTSALSTMKQAMLGMIMYSGDHDDRLPLAVNWMDVTKPYVSTRIPMATLFHIPDVPETAPDGTVLYGMAFRHKLSGAHDDEKLQNPNLIVAIFDSTDLSLNASGGLDLLPKPPRHHGPDGNRNAIAFADGHAKWMSPPYTGVR